MAYLGQVQSLFCADEVFCGRAPHRGTETCAVVEAMASLEYAYAVFGDAYASIMDRVERLAFNAMPAALTGKDLNLLLFPIPTPNLVKPPL